MGCDWISGDKAGYTETKKGQTVQSSGPLGWSIGEKWSLEIMHLGCAGCETRMRLEIPMGCTWSTEYSVLGASNIFIPMYLGRYTSNIMLKASRYIVIL